MADGLTTQSATPATIPAGTEIATDDAGGDGHVQIIKLAISTDGSATVIPADASNGLDVDVTRIAAGTNIIGKVRLVDADGDEISVVAGVLQTSGSGGGGGGVTEAIRTQVTPTVSTSPAYIAKDAVGALLTFSSVVATSGGTVQVLQVQVVDKAQQMKDYDLILFDRSITAPTDNSIFDPTDTELGYVCGIIPIGGWADFSDNSVFDAPVNIVADLNGTALYGVLVSRSGTGPTFAGTSDIVVTLTTADLSG